MYRKQFHRASFRFVVAVMIGLIASPVVAQSATERLQQLFDDYESWRLVEFPGFAMSQGDYSNADRVTDNSLAAIERRHKTEKDYLDRLLTISPTELSESDRVNYELFELARRRSIDGHKFRTFLMPIGGRFGPQTQIPQMGERVRFESVEDYENYVKRVEQIPTMVDDIIELLQTGLDEGRTPPQITVIGVPDQFDVLVDGEGLSMLRSPFAKVPPTLPRNQVNVVKQKFDDEAMPAVRDAMRKLGDFVENEYVPNCRDTIAAADYPDGKAYYEHQLRVMTTLDLSAREVHETGLREVKRIRREMMDVIRRSDFMEIRPDASSLSDDELFDAFIEYLRTDERFYHKTAKDLIDGYKAICKTVDAQMPLFFKTLPRQPYGVREIPRFMAPTQTTAYYSSGDLRNGQPGFFYANTYKLDQRPKYEMIALAIHEAVPGHHHQIAIAKELEDVPEFRRSTWFTAFGEGWGLYSERLGIEMGLYEDPYDDFGRLLYEMWRATRLVVDPGMHAFGWSRQRAIDFMLDNTALSELNIINEVDRYIAWPGQATAYKIGELKIRELRAKAENALGEKFSLRDFHDVVLTAGSVPLPVLERRVNDWIASAQ